MSLIQKKLTTYKLSKEIIDLYRDNISDDSLTGIVSGFSEQFILLNLLSDDGEDNGISVIYRKDITRIRAGGNVRGSIKELREFRSTTLNSPDIKLNSVETVLSSIQLSYGCVNIHTESMRDDICFIGQILEQDQHWISLLGYGTMTSRDTNSMLIEKDEISRIDAGGKYEESIKYLTENSRKFLKLAPKPK